MLPPLGFMVGDLCQHEAGSEVHPFFVLPAPGASTASLCRRNCWNSAQAAASQRTQSCTLAQRSRNSTEPSHDIRADSSCTMDVLYTVSLCRVSSSTEVGYEDLEVGRGFILCARIPMPFIFFANPRTPGYPGLVEQLLRCHARGRGLFRAVAFFLGKLQRDRVSIP